MKGLKILQALYRGKVTRQEVEILKRERALAREREAEEERRRLEKAKREEGERLEQERIAREKKEEEERLERERLEREKMERERIEREKQEEEERREKERLEREKREEEERLEKERLEKERLEKERLEREKREEKERLERERREEEARKEKELLEEAERRERELKARLEREREEAAKAEAEAQRQEAIARAEEEKRQKQREAEEEEAQRQQRKREEEAAIVLQSAWRGHQARLQAAKARERFVRSVDKIVKIQAFFRAKVANRQYRDLTMGENPPINAMRPFVHLLDDSEQDFEEELELERLRQQAVRRIRENQGTERVLNDLDIKIALLVRNSITLEEVIKASRRHYRVVDDLEMAHAMLKGLDKESRQRLEGYQQLFYLLQTHPPYLARLLTALRDGAPDRVKKVVETVVLTIFGFAQNPREEYLLLKLFKAAIAQEMEGVESPEEFLRSNPTFIKLAIHYQRGAKERKYLRDLLQPLVRYILEDPNLDLETDPLVIYRGLIREEESRTGVRSARKYDVTREDALADVDTRSRLIEHLKQLRALTDQFVEAIQSSLPYMPYGIRYLARELKEAMLNKFPEERETQVMKVVGNLVYYRYINPAIV